MSTLYTYIWHDDHTYAITSCRLGITVVYFGLFCKTVARIDRWKGPTSFAHQYYSTIEMKKKVYSQAQVVF